MSIFFCNFASEMTKACNLPVMLFRMPSRRNGVYVYFRGEANIDIKGVY